MTMYSEDPEQTRTLRALALPARVHDAQGAPVCRGLYVDCETTGFDWARDEVIELALLPFTHTADGRVVEVLHGEAQTHLRDPGRPIPEAITALTGLTDDDVRGRHIDVEAASALVRRSDLVVAHNARFDRPFFERVLPVMRDKPWACSRLEVPWRASGTASDALHCLLCHFGAYARDRHRALADCEAGVWLLAQALPGTERPALSVLLERSEAETVRLWALHSPIEAKGVLRARGYRWMPEGRNGIPRAWWTEVAPEMVAAERAWLRAEVYGPFRPAYNTGPPAFDVALRRVSAHERWRADPADCPVPGGR
ncbi:MAG: 3'-5' exonuclease [Gammaproteobacteria bacterium]|nr:3'-5' exonuclease [Gammaproteobacteria bacterium]